MKLNKFISTILTTVLLLNMVMPVIYAVDIDTINIQITGQENYDMALEVIDIVNEERQAQGQEVLTFDKELSDAAMQRAAEIAIFYEHTRPNGESCTDMKLPTMYVNGENIAVYQTSPISAMNDWMNSSYHKENILRKEFKSIGVGCFVKDNKYYWVQSFSCLNSSNSDSSQITGIKTVTKDISIDKDFIEDKIFFEMASKSDLYTEQFKIPLNTPTDIYIEVHYRYENYVVDTKLDDSNYTFTVNDNSIANIENGKITFLKNGKVTVTADINGYSISQEIESAIEPTNINVENNKMVVLLDEPSQINASIEPSDANVMTEIVYKSSNESILKVDEKTGIITPISTGTANVYVFVWKKKNSTSLQSYLVKNINVTVIPEYPRGDVNMDGKVNAGDYVAILNYVRKKIVLTDVQLQRADANGDGKVNAGDYVTILNIVRGKI